VAWPTEHVVLPRSQAQVRSVLQKHGKGHWGPIPLSPSLTLVVEKLAKTGIMSVSQMHSYNFWYTHSGLGRHAAQLIRMVFPPRRLKTQQALVCHRKAVQLGEITLPSSTLEACLLHRLTHNSSAPHLAQLYGSGQSIVELSAKYDLPPVVR